MLSFHCVFAIQHFREGVSSPWMNGLEVFGEIKPTKLAIIDPQLVSLWRADFHPTLKNVETFTFSCVYLLYNHLGSFSFKL